jgi:hypothetical protein
MIEKPERELGGIAAFNQKDGPDTKVAA